MSEMAVMDLNGDTKIIWDKDNPDEVENARRSFDELRAKGFAAYSVAEKGAKGRTVSKFDPTAEKIIMVPAMVAG